MTEKIIHKRFELPCSVQEAFNAFLQEPALETWFTEKARVTPEVGGHYELFFEPDHPERNATVGCKITALVPNQLLAFDWKGPVEFEDFMNGAEPLTHVTIAFFPQGEGTELHVIHTGWRPSEPWQEAREYFVRAWDQVLNALEVYVNQSE